MKKKTISKKRVAKRTHHIYGSISWSPLHSPMLINFQIVEVQNKKPKNKQKAYFPGQDIEFSLKIINNSN